MEKVPTTLLNNRGLPTVEFGDIEEAVNYVQNFNGPVLAVDLTVKHPREFQTNEEFLEYGVQGLRAALDEGLAASRPMAMVELTNEFIRHLLTPEGYERIHRAIKGISKPLYSTEFTEAVRFELKKKFAKQLAKAERGHKGF
jgi:hypothetical protein